MPHKDNGHRKPLVKMGLAEALALWTALPNDAARFYRFCAGGNEQYDIRKAPVSFGFADELAARNWIREVAEETRSGQYDPDTGKEARYDTAGNQTLG